MSATVILVKTAALKDNSDGREDLAKFAAAVATRRESRVSELLDGLTSLVTGPAFVFIGRHRKLQYAPATSAV